MINGNSHQPGEVTPMASDTRASNSGLSHDTFTAMVGQMVVQCKALLRQQARAEGKWKGSLTQNRRTNTQRKTRAAGRMAKGGACAPLSGQWTQFSNAKCCPPTTQRRRPHR